MELQRGLPGISTEQLRSRLNRMVADGLLTRERYREVPPRVDYELTDRARDLLPVLGALARWGFDWVWGAPRSGEDVDIGAIVRLAPGLVHPPRSLRGTVVVEASGKQGERRDYALTIADGRVSLQEGEPARADARVSGAERDWIAALGPEGRREAVRVTGDQRLAGAVLDGLSGLPVSRSAAA